MQPHARHVGLDLRDFDAVIGFAWALRDAGHVCAAALARAGEDIAPGGWVGMKRTMRPSMRLGVALGRGWHRRLLPLRRRTLELSGVFGGRPSFASSSAIRATSDAFCATSASTRATSAAIKASFSGKSGGGLTRRLTQILDVAATKKRQSQTTAHLHTIKGGVSNCKNSALFAKDTLRYAA
jgi:hypothetical protein